jgi:hypothetical protein
MNARSFALIVVRSLGLLFFTLGALGVLGIVVAQILRNWAWSALPVALRDNFDYFYAADLWGSPFYLLAGIVLLAASKGVASTISRGVES